MFTTNYTVPWTITVENVVISEMCYAIQIKICAEYRDMLPRPRLVCQEPGLRPIGRSPGVPDKSSRGLGSMSRYRDMLPRPRLVCQEPGLRPIGRSPGVPDKSSRGLGSMSRYSAQILICFIAYIFSISLWVWLGTLQNCHHAQCPLPLFIVIRMRLLSAHQTIKSPSMPCWGAAGRNTLWHSCHRTGEISRQNGWNMYQREVFSTGAK